MPKKLKELQSVWAVLNRLKSDCLVVCKSLFYMHNHNVQGFFLYQDSLKHVFSMKYFIAFKMSTNIGDMVKIGKNKSVITNVDQIIVYTNNSAVTLKKRHFLKWRYFGEVILKIRKLISSLLFFCMLSPATYCHGYKWRNYMEFLWSLLNRWKLVLLSFDVVSGSSESVPPHCISQEETIWQNCRIVNVQRIFWRSRRLLHASK